MVGVTGGDGADGCAFEGREVHWRRGDGQAVIIYGHIYAAAHGEGWGVIDKSGFVYACTGALVAKLNYHFVTGSRI